MFDLDLSDCLWAESTRHLLVFFLIARCGGCGMHGAKCDSFILSRQSVR